MKLTYMGSVGGLGRSTRVRDRFELYKPVRLRVGTQVEGVDLEAGTRGVVVDRYGSGRYGVEFGAPIMDVLILSATVLEKIIERDG